VAGHDGLLAYFRSLAHMVSTVPVTGPVTPVTACRAASHCLRMRLERTLNVKVARQLPRGREFWPSPAGEDSSREVGRSGPGAAQLSEAPNLRDKG